jgi:hypothetical protein
LGSVRPVTKPFTIDLPTIRAVVASGILSR